ncbi:MAG: hypothetical protein FJY65_06395 [Calditrichaeota bacterium]|nr:hypothetical protein [Calditrichota bacterium]
MFKKRPKSAQDEQRRSFMMRMKMFSRKTGLFIVQVVTLAVLVLAFGVWSADKILKQSLGNVRLFSWKKAVASIYGSPKILLIDPRRTQRFLLPPDSAETDTAWWPYRPRNDKWPYADTLWYSKEIEKKKGTEIEVWKLIGSFTEKQSTLIDYWEDILFKRGAKAFDIAEEPALVDLGGKFSIVIIPGALLLSKEERQGIKDYIAGGGNVLFSWSTGCRWETGEWSGFEFLSHIIGGIISGSITDSAGSTSFILRGRSPITAMLAPGTHLDYFLYDGYVSFDIVEPRTSADAFLFIPYWQTDRQSTAQNRCVIAHGGYLKGRFVWLAFAPAAVQEQKKDNKVVLDQIVNNSLDWLIGKPVVAPQIWPSGYRAAASLVLDIDASPEETRDILQFAKEKGIEFDVMLDPTRMPYDIQAPQGSYGEPILVFADQGPTGQYDSKGLSRWMANNSALIERSLGKPVNVVHPMTWMPNETALRAAARAEISVILGCFQPRFYGGRGFLVRHGGWLFFTPNVSVATVPKCQLSLAEWRLASATYGNISPERGMFADFRRIANAGGLYVAVFEAKTLSKMAMRDLPYRLAQEMDTTGVWRTSLSEAAHRFAGWEWLRVKTSLVTNLRVKVDLSNIGKVRLTDMVFDVYLPHQFQQIEVSAQRVGATPTYITYNPAHGRFSFIVPKLSPGENTAIFLDLKEETTAASK